MPNTPRHNLVVLPVNVSYFMYKSPEHTGQIQIMRVENTSGTYYRTLVVVRGRYLDNLMAQYADIHNAINEVLKGNLAIVSMGGMHSASRVLRTVVCAEHDATGNRGRLILRDLSDRDIDELSVSHVVGQYTTEAEFKILSLRQAVVVIDCDAHLSQAIPVILLESLMTMTEARHQVSAVRIDDVGDEVARDRCLDRLDRTLSLVGNG